MPEYNCEKGCCKILQNKYEDKPFVGRRSIRKKAGVFIYDPVEKRVLLVQSRGRLWGPPKGTMELGETNIQCAIREVKEETGLIITKTDTQYSIRINKKATYYYCEMKTCDINVQENEDEEANDANGITWIKIDCLKKCVSDGHIVLNKQCEFLFMKIKGISFSKTPIFRKI